MKGGEVEV